jgi:hypothetical protein
MQNTDVALSPYELALVDIPASYMTLSYTASCNECALATKTSKEGIMGCRRIFLSPEYYCHLVQRKIYALRHKVSGRVLTQLELEELYGQHRRECNQPN